MTPDSIAARIRKVHTLAADPSATEGERTAASEALERLLSRYGLKLEDLSDETVRDIPFPVTDPHETTLLLHLCGMVRGWVDGEDLYYKTHRGDTSRVWLSLTPAQAKELHSLFEFYRTAWREELAAVMRAYLHSHGLVRPADPNAPTPSLDVEELLRLRSLAGGFQPRTRPRRQIPTEMSGR